MKTSILYAGLSSPHAGWAAIDEIAELLVHYFNAEILSPKLVPSPWAARLIRRNHQSYEQLHTTGGDVLIVVARGPGDLGMINTIPDCRQKFDKIYGLVTDSYYQQGFVKETNLYDAITVTAHEDIEYPKVRFNIPVHQLYQGADCLKWAPSEQKKREIDIIGFGRTPQRYHTNFAKRFHRANSPYLYLHSPLGNVTGPSVHLERGMLFKLLHRTNISLAFHLLVDPEGERPRSMMITSRWLESLLSGCIVAGRRPESQMADEMLCWPKATVELSEDPDTASEELITLLLNQDSLEEQRLVNIFQMMNHHDWRYRIKNFCGMMNLTLPEKLKTDLWLLEERAASFKNSC
ncbi:MAG: glycosyltransferase family 1 protein [Chlorobiaceae bacterium]